eukprot:39401-Eustigmatos_ZCMA.PRE.1
MDLRTHSACVCLVVAAGTAYSWPPEALMFLHACTYRSWHQRLCIMHGVSMYPCICNREWTPCGPL